jgi:hypothetical protein
MTTPTTAGLKSDDSAKQTRPSSRSVGKRVKKMDRKII